MKRGNTIWPPIVAGSIAILAILADLFIERFRAFAVAHAMITALVAMGVFALVTVWLIDWLSNRREQNRRSGVTSNAVRVAANLGWAAVSHRAMSWPNLRNSEVAAEAKHAVQAYQALTATLALTPNPDDGFYELMSAHDKLGAALDEYIEREPGALGGEDARFDPLLELQGSVDAASWPYVKRLLPDYWRDAERFTPPFAEPPGWFLHMPRRPVRRSPDPDSPTKTADTKDPIVNLGSDAVGDVLAQMKWNDDAPF